MRTFFVTFIFHVIFLFTFFQGNAQKVTFHQLQPLLHKETDSTYVVNFWATWCGPCVKELPHFEEVAKKYENMKLSVVYVSLDFPNHYENKVLPFIKERNISHTVLLLDEQDPNLWIDSVSPDWQGAIPATLIYNSKKRQFFEREFTFETLDSIIHTFINP